MTSLIAVALLSALGGLAVGAWVAAHCEQQRAVRRQLRAYGRGYQQAANDILHERNN